MGRMGTGRRRPRSPNERRQRRPSAFLILLFRPSCGSCRPVDLTSRIHRVVHPPEAALYFGLFSVREKR